MKQNQIAEADKSYAELDAAYPEAKERDQVLNEWATVLYDGQQFERADALFKKLVKMIADKAKKTVTKEVEVMNEETAHLEEAVAAQEGGDGDDHNDADC